jgi:hypoxanthine phosphoribosyltransferase
MGATKSKIYLSWDSIDVLINILTPKINPKIDSIMGLPRGGLIPAVILSHKLKLPLVFTPTENTLIVDDICDSGETFLNTPGKYFAALHFKPTSKFKNLIYGAAVGDDWIVYPWEDKTAEGIQDYLKLYKTT